MTNNEAIRILGLERDDWETSHCSPLVRKKAFDMAIEALKAQDVPDTNVGDLISRQAVIDALDVLCQEHRYRIPGKRETYSQYNEAWQDALGRAESIIGNLPSAQPEITLESAIDYLHRIGWMQEHDRILTESAQPDDRLAKIADLVEGTIDHFDLDDAMELLYQIKEVLK